MSKILFSNGSEYMDWRAGNCEWCKKDYCWQTQAPKCDIEERIALASCTDGTLTCDGVFDEESADEIARRLGWDGESDLPSNCPEFEGKEGA